MEFSSRLKKLREIYGLTQLELAKILEISRGLYSQYEIADKIIPIHHLDKLANHFCVSVDNILGFSDNKIDNAFTIDKKVVGVRLKEFRKENKLTQEKLANILNTSHSTISSYEKGNTLILTSFLYTICKKYGISSDYLLGRVDEPKYLNNKSQT